MLAWLEGNDVIIVDPGFRDSIETMNALGLQVAIPPFLNGRKSVILIFQYSFRKIIFSFLLQKPIEFDVLQKSDGLLKAEMVRLSEIFRI